MNELEILIKHLDDVLAILALCGIVIEITPIKINPVSYLLKKAGNGFLNFPGQPLPVDITTYDSTKMTASLATRFTDGAGIINAGISNGYKSISMCGQNKYGSQINGSIICNFRIDVYNS